jgi:hypothetical protein
MEITVTEDDLNLAIELTRQSKESTTRDICATCILAVAVQRQIEQAKRVGFNSVHDAETDKSLGHLYPRQTCNTVTSLFDDENYDEVRALLPLTLTFERDAEGDE